MAPAKKPALAGKSRASVKRTVSVRTRAETVPERAPKPASAPVPARGRGRAPVAADLSLEARHLIDGLGSVSDLMTHPGMRAQQGMLRATKHAMLRRLAQVSGLAADLVDAPQLSGAQWVSRFPGSSSTGSLAPSFRPGAEDFIAAMRAAGAAVAISATLRPVQRAYLMHWSWMIAREGADPRDAIPMADVDIVWVHDSAAESRQAADVMVRGYGIVSEPALSSRHTEGLAIDMTISWSGSLSIADGSGARRQITSMPRSGLNPELIAFGATYGVIKATFSGDPPHWSSDGH